MQNNPNNPMHGVKLEDIINDLVKHFGWEELAKRINVNCFKSNPSVKSTLTFLRKTPWARTKVEKLYLSIQS
ncbi:MAG: VF530 family protein [Arcobacteraceae bacterium]